MARRLPPEIVVGVARIIDGDTIEVSGTTIRLFGIDAPELRQQCETRSGEALPCGRQAAAALAAGINGGALSCVGRDHDRYRRLVAVCWANGIDIGGRMVRQGWALSYRQYSHDYVAAERQAQMNHRGLWADRFDAPWDWRHSHRRRHNSF